MSKPTTYLEPRKATASNSTLLNRLPPAPPQRPPRPWPIDIPPGELEQWANSSIHHFLAIRATGSVPDAGGPSVPIATCPTTAAALQQALQLAENYWPNARQFDLIGADLEYKSAGETEGLEDGMNRLRNAVTIVTFNVTDRPALIPPKPKRE